MERMSPFESHKTLEKSREKLYFDTLKAKRDVLSSHYVLNQLRKGKKIEEMSDTEVEDYKSVKNEYDKRRELFLASFDSLNEEDGQKVSELTSLTKVEIALSSFEKPAEAEIETTPTPAPTPEGADQTVIETPIDQTPEEIVSPTEAESPDRGTTMAEVDRMLKYAKGTARPLETAYWESKKAELLERQEAEANPDRPAPKGFMQRVKDTFARGKDAITRGYIKGSEMIHTFLRKEEKEPVSPTDNVEAEPAQPEATPQQPEKEPKKASAWGWLKERGKGLLTVGIWEFHQAERFRKKTKEVANDTKELATQIQQERNLGLEEAQTEAQEIMAELKKENLDGIGTSEFYQANSDIIDERKRKENDQEIENIINSARNDLLDKLAKYRGEAGQDVLIKENQLAFEADLRGELNKIRDGAFRKDFVNFAKLMRRNLDEKWQWRYVWGTAEALAWAGVGWVSMKFLAAKGATETVAVAAGGTGGAEAAREFVEKGMHENVWNTLKGMAQNGPEHFTPTAAQLKVWSQGVLNSIKHYEPEWINNAVEGLKSSRAMPEGFSLKIPVEIMKEMKYPGF